MLYLRLDLFATFLGFHLYCLGLECTALLPLASAARCEGGNAALSDTPPPTFPTASLGKTAFLGLVNHSWGHGCVVSLEMDTMPPGLGGGVGGWGHGWWQEGGWVGLGWVGLG